MIEDLQNLKMEVHQRLMDDLISFVPAIERIYEHIAKVTEEDEVINFKFLMKIDDLTEELTANVHIDGMGNLELDNEYYFFHIDMEDGVIQKITVDDDLIVRQGEHYFSNLDMEHWESLCDLYYLIAAFNEKFDVGIEL